MANISGIEGKLSLIEKEYGKAIVFQAEDEFDTRLVLDKMLEMINSSTGYDFHMDYEPKDTSFILLNQLGGITDYGLGFALDKTNLTNTSEFQMPREIVPSSIRVHVGMPSDGYLADRVEISEHPFANRPPGLGRDYFDIIYSDMIAKPENISHMQSVD